MTLKTQEKNGKQALGGYFCRVFHPRGLQGVLVVICVAFSVSSEWPESWFEENRFCYVDLILFVGVLTSIQNNASFGWKVTKKYGTISLWLKARRKYTGWSIKKTPKGGNFFVQGSKKKTPKFLGVFFWTFGQSGVVKNWGVHRGPKKNPKSKEIPP